jgi:hypothetical protein
MVRHASAVLVMMVLAHAAAAQYTQQGSKLVGTGAVNPADQGGAVAISADGNTAIVGAYSDSSNAGAAWVYTRSGGVWSQQGSKLVGAGAAGPAYQGVSAAISADGNTAMVGGITDNAHVGAAWVYTRSGGVWSQQGSKLVGAGGTGATNQGWAMAISADGNTAIVGGYADNSNLGAAWVFTRTGGVWSQQGNKLVGADAVGAAAQGMAAALSADGNTAVVGGPGDATNTGAAWVYTRTGGVWSQQGSKLVGAGAVGAARQGVSVAISGDGTTAFVGGNSDDSQTGAVWVFTRTGGVWSQQGGKLVGAGAIGPANQGWSVAASADGSTAAIGGYSDNSNAGATWLFTRGGGVWSQMGNKLVGTGAVGSAYQGTRVAISGDGTTLIVAGHRDNSNAGAVWVFSASTLVTWVPVVSHSPGAAESQWRSDLGLVNTGASTANYEVRWHSGGTLKVSTSYLTAGSQAILQDVVNQLGGSGSGSLEVRSIQPLIVTSRTYNLVAGSAGCYPNGTLGQDYPAFQASDGLAAGKSAILGQLVESSAYRTNIGLANAGASTASATVALINGAGMELNRYTVTLAPGELKQENRPFFTKAGQTNMQRGYARVSVTAGSGVYAYGSVVDNITNDPTTVPMVKQP